MFVVAVVVVPGMTPVGGGSTCDNHPEHGAAIGNRKMCRIISLVEHIGIHPAAVFLESHKTVTPSGLVHIEFAITVRPGQTDKVSFDLFARLGNVEPYYVVTVVFEAAFGIDLPVIQGIAGHVDALTADVIFAVIADFIDVPGDQTGGTIVHFVVESGLIYAGKPW